MFFLFSHSIVVVACSLAQTTIMMFQNAVVVVSFAFLNLKRTGVRDRRAGILHSVSKLQNSKRNMPKEGDRTTMMMYIFPLRRVLS
jgi:hypothetical protein